MSNAEKMVSVPRALLMEAEASLRASGMAVTLAADIRKVLDQQSEQHQSEPVAWVRFRNGEPDYDGDAVMISNVRGDILGDGDSWEPVYTHADAGEVERLRELLLKPSARTQFDYDRGFTAGTAECETFRAKLAERDALLTRAAKLARGMVVHPWASQFARLVADIQRIGISASAEPSAPVAWARLVDGVQVDGIGLRVTQSGVGEYMVDPSAPVERGERAEFDPLEWLETEIGAVDTWYRGSPSYERDAGWMKDQALNLIEQARAALERKL